MDGESDHQGHRENRPLKMDFKCGDLLPDVCEDQEGAAGMDQSQMSAQLRTSTNQRRQIATSPDGSYMAVLQSWRILVMASVDLKVMSQGFLQSALCSAPGTRSVVWAADSAHILCMDSDGRNIAVYDRRCQLLSTISVERKLGLDGIVQVFPEKIPEKSQAAISTSASRAPPSTSTDTTLRLHVITRSSIVATVHLFTGSGEASVVARTKTPSTGVSSLS